MSCTRNFSPGIALSWLGGGGGSSLRSFSCHFHTVDSLNVRTAASPWNENPFTRRNGEIELEALTPLAHESKAHFVFFRQLLLGSDAWHLSDYTRHKCVSSAYKHFFFSFFLILNHFPFWERGQREKNERQKILNRREKRVFSIIQSCCDYNLIIISTTDTNVNGYRR